MAAECPEALADLRAMVEAGWVEPVGCSYGQPYGLFHGGESNIRQFTYGVRATRRLLGVRPRTFWEEEFYWFPQLPQVLRGCGYTGACLFFQWTWHTPEVPKEAASLIWWEGIDGSRILTLPRNDLNVHQWPEDFDGLLEQGLVNELEHPAIVQWLELMPSRDWMCRSEVLLPRLKELMGDGRFDVRPRTMGGLIEELSKGATKLPDDEAASEIPVRRYGPDDMWHGVTLGKNGDSHPRSSAYCESKIMSAEAIASLLGLVGRPYPSWDVYPSWELEEAWRELLAAQHHDNHECERLCGFVGEASFMRAENLAGNVDRRCIESLAARLDVIDGTIVVFNPSGDRRDMLLTTSMDLRGEVVEDVPAFGYRVVPRATRGQTKVHAHRQRGDIILSRGDMRVEIDSRRGVITQIKSADFPEGVLAPDRPIGALSLILPEGEETFDDVEVELTEFAGRPTVVVARISPDGRGGVGVRISLGALLDAVEISFMVDHIPTPAGGLHGGLTTHIAPAMAPFDLVHDHPYGVGETTGRGRRVRKYPTGDWMTSRQVFEDVVDPVTALRFVDLVETGGQRGLLCLHDGSQQWFRTDEGVECLLTTWDPWDGDFRAHVDAGITLLPHGPMTHVQRVRVAKLTRSNWLVGVHAGERGKLPDVFGPIDLDASSGVRAEAFHRESAKSGEHLPDWAGHRMAAESQGACTHPFVLRLVEWNDEPAEVTLKLVGEAARVAKTNPLGETGPWRFGEAPPGAPAHLRDTGWLDVEPADPPAWAGAVRVGGRAPAWSRVRLSMRRREIATVMADLVMGRKQWRDLDAKREVWATIHKADMREERGS
jgi:alpha-mannosidase